MLVSVMKSNNCRCRISLFGCKVRRVIVVFKSHEKHVVAN